MDILISSIKVKNEKLMRDVAYKLALLVAPMIPHIAEDGYTASAGHLLMTWVILLVFAVVPLALGTVALRRVKNDGRG